MVVGLIESVSVVPSRTSAIIMIRLKFNIFLPLMTKRGVADFTLISLTRRVFSVFLFFFGMVVGLIGVSLSRTKGWF